MGVSCSYKGQRVRSTGFRVRWRWISPSILHLPAPWPGSATLGLSFLTCKMGVMITTCGAIAEISGSKRKVNATPGRAAKLAGDFRAPLRAPGRQ